MTQVYSRNFEKADELAKKINADPIDNLDHIRDEADVDMYIIAVSDDAIKDVVSQLKVDNKIVVHTSGATSKEILKEATPNYGILYPYQTLKKGDIIDVSNMCVFFDGSNEETLLTIEEIAYEVTNFALQAGDEERLRYHLAAVIANNFSNHLFALAEKMMLEHHLDFETLKPIILQTAQNALISSPAQNQTGPAIRGDHQTMEKHLELLENDPNLKKIYSDISKSIQDFVPAEIEAGEEESGASTV